VTRSCRKFPRRCDLGREIVLCVAAFGVGFVLWADHQRQFLWETDKLAVPRSTKTYAERRDAQNNLLPRSQRLGNFLHDLVTPSTWNNLMRWEIQRRPFTPTAWDNFGNSVVFYFAVRKDYVPYLSQSLQLKARNKSRHSSKPTHSSRSPPIYANRQLWRGWHGRRDLGSVGPIAVDGQAMCLLVMALGAVSSRSRQMV